MKVSKALLVFLSSVILVSCFDSPEFSNIPKIKYEDIYFGKARNEFSPDSLVLEISFEDGDGDLGLEQSFVDEPFHPTNFYIARNGSLIPIGTRTYDPALPPFLAITTDHLGGTLATLNTSRDAAYTNKMANYAADSACIYYSGDINRFDFAIQVDSVLVYGPDAAAISEFSEVYEATSPTLPESFFVVKDTFYVQRNPAYQNIEVKFFRKQNVNSPFEEVDFYKLLCQEIFEGRFPVLSDKENALSGTIKYSMKSTQFENVLATGIWQLEIRIRDRALHTSDAIRTKEFTLAEILR